MKLHDTHAHLDYLLVREPNLKSEDMIKDHEFWIQPGVNLVRDRYCLENFLKFDNMYFMIGAHPGEVNEKWDLEEFLIGQQELIRDYEKFLYNKIIAIGEIGLDYRDDTTIFEKEEQKLLFNIQIKLAKELNLPFVIHCRDAWDDLFKIIETNLPLKKPFLVHCYTSNKENYSKIVNLGGYVAFGGIITYKNTAELNEAVKIAENYVIETDLPWLAPTPHRGKVNMPEYINLVIDHLAQSKNLTSQEVIEKSKNNTKLIFGEFVKK
jgi:TatD DNase family protein